MTKIGVIARADLTGLGVQSRNWVRLLDPHKVIIINSKPFNGNEQHPEWYEGRNSITINGFIKDEDIDRVLDDIDLLLTFEIPYNYNIFKVAKKRGVKTILQNNWEFTDYLQRDDLPLPDLLVNHSDWFLDEQRKRWPDIADYCPSPVFSKDYDDIYKENLNRTGKKRFLHVAGRKTYEDRNGTNDLVAAVKLIPKEVDFELVIKSQTAEIDGADDPRIKIDRSEPEDEKELYRGFDAMILPRRYGGACLPVGEALTAGLPVIMTNVEPNSTLLPNEWLVKSEKKTSFMARTKIDVYSADHKELANKIIEFAESDLDKEMASEIAFGQFSDQMVKLRWDLLMKKIGL